jgi:hypothetical protein
MRKSRLEIQMNASKILSIYTSLSGTTSEIIIYINKNYLSIFELLDII